MFLSKLSKLDMVIFEQKLSFVNCCTPMSNFSGQLVFNIQPFLNKLLLILSLRKSFISLTRKIYGFYFDRISVFDEILKLMSQLNLMVKSMFFFYLTDCGHSTVTNFFVKLFNKCFLPL